jgi:hypothetical protein
MKRECAPGRFADAAVPPEPELRRIAQILVDPHFVAFNPFDNEVAAGKLRIDLRLTGECARSKNKQKKLNRR